MAKQRESKLVTQSEYARRIGVTRQAVYAAVVSQRITLVGGLIDPERADREWAENTDPSKPRGIAARDWMR